MDEQVVFDPVVSKVLGVSGIKLLEKFNTFCCICGGDKILYINPAGLKVLNVENDKTVVGRALGDFVDPDFANIMAKGLGAFVDEATGVPMTMISTTNQHIYSHVYVEEIPVAGEADPLFMVECHDVTAFITAAQETKQRQDRLNGILSSVAEAIVTMDSTGIINEFNPAAENIFGYTKAQANGKNINIIIPLTGTKETSGLIERYLSTSTSQVSGIRFEIEAARKDDSRFPAEITLSSMRNSTGELSLTAVIRDITLQKIHEQQLFHTANHDQLTGLPNRLMFEDRLKSSVLQSRRTKILGALMFIDLDNFKPINDAFGHEAGDIVLKGVGNRLQEAVRATDTVARIGGDEFVVVLGEISKTEDAETIAANIIASLDVSFMISEEACKVGASIGISIYPSDSLEVDEIIKYADMAMYHVKETGRNNFAYYHDLKT